MQSQQFGYSVFCASKCREWQDVREHMDVAYTNYCFKLLGYAKGYRRAKVEHACCSVCCVVVIELWKIKWDYAALLSLMTTYMTVVDRI